MKRKINYILARILSVINVFFPKDKNLIFFYDSMNQILLDNTEAIYSYIVEHDKNNKYKKVVLIAKSKDKPSKIKCAYYFMRAYYVFLSFGDLRIRPANNQIVVNQWHGSPIKTIGKLTKYEDYKNETLDNFTYIICSSKLFVEPFAKAFGCNPNKVKILGQARNDYLFNRDISDFYKFDLSGNNYNKCIIWMPTFRISEDNRFKDSNMINEETMLPIFSTFEELNKLNSYLNELNILLVIKSHGHASIVKKDYTNIRYITNDDLIRTNTKLYLLVKDFDALITDYSSIFTDFYLLNKPVGFTVDDYDSYMNERGFAIKDPKQYMTGSLINNSNDFYNYISNVSNGIDDFEEQRVKMNRVMNKYDNDNCKRLCELTNLKF